MAQRDNAKSELRNIFETTVKDTKILIQKDETEQPSELPEWLSIFSVARQPSGRYKYTGQHIILPNLPDGPLGKAILALESLPGIVELGGAQRWYKVKNNDWEFLPDGPDAISESESVELADGKQWYVVKHNDWIARHPNLEYNDYRPDQLTQDDYYTMFDDAGNGNDGNFRRGKGSKRTSLHDRQALADVQGF